MEGNTIFSKDGNGRTRLDCTGNGKTVSYLWEPIGNGHLETIFNENGHILKQEMCSNAEKRIGETLLEFGPAENAEFHEINIDKKCPSCDAAALSRYCEAFASSGTAPVMPIYYCRSCKSKSYYLTDDYLNYLVDAKRALFEDAEIESMANGRERFLTELRDYIIRMFASKRILTIK